MSAEHADLPVYRTTVIEDWIDYNGHLSEAYYVLVFGFATDALMDRIGMDAATRQATGSSLYTVEAHIRYLREVGLGEQLSVTTQIVFADDKRLHLAHSMSAAGVLIATEEVMCLHVAGTPAAVASFPEPVAERIEALPGESGSSVPDWVGRSIGRR